MINNTIYEFLDVLAEQHIPEGKHRLLHIDARSTWVSVMITLLESGLVAKKMTLLKKCAVNWEAILYQKISTQN